MRWEFMKATFPADTVGIHERNMSCWCGGNSWNQHHFLLMRWDFMKSTSFLLMRWDFMKAASFPADVVGIHERIQSNIISDAVGIHVDAWDCKTCHCQNFYFVPLLTLLVCLFLRNLGRCCRQKRFLRSRRTTSEVKIAPCRLRLLDDQTEGWSGLVDGSLPDGCSGCCLLLGNKHLEGPKHEPVSCGRCSSSRLAAAAAAGLHEPADPVPGEEIS